MKPLYPDLWQTSKEARFSTLTRHAYIPDQPAGATMIYAAQEWRTLQEIADREEIVWP